MTRIAIDWDGDGAFAVLTRPGHAAEVVRLPDIDRTAVEAMTAALASRGLSVSGGRYNPDRPDYAGVEDGPPPAIGMLGE